MAAKLLSTRPKNGETGGQCVEYAGMKCFGKRFGADSAKDIWTNTVTNTGVALPYKKHNEIPSTPCCIVWGNGADGHVGVIESVNGSAYTYSDSNRVSYEKVSVSVQSSLYAIKQLIGESDFLGYVQFP